MHKSHAARLAPCGSDFAKNQLFYSLGNLRFGRIPFRQLSSRVKLTGTISDAIPTPRPEKNLPEFKSAAFVPKPIKSQPPVNGIAVIIRAILRPTKSIAQPPIGPPIIAPMLRSDCCGKKVPKLISVTTRHIHLTAIKLSLKNA